MVGGGVVAVRCRGTAGRGEEVDALAEDWREEGKEGWWGSRGKEGSGKAGKDRKEQGTSVGVGYAVHRELLTEQVYGDTLPRGGLEEHGDGLGTPNGEARQMSRPHHAADVEGVELRNKEGLCFL